MIFYILNLSQLSKGNFNVKFLLIGIGKSENQYLEKATSSYFKKNIFSQQL